MVRCRFCAWSTMRAKTHTECWIEEQACKKCYVDILERFNWSPLARSYWNLHYIDGDDR